MGCETVHTACRPLPCKLELTALASISARCGAPTQRHASHSRSENALPTAAASARNAGSIPVPREGWTDVQDAQAGLAHGVSVVCIPNSVTKTHRLPIRRDDSSQQEQRRLPPPGIEPGASAWQAEILTTILQRNWCVCLGAPLTTQSLCLARFGPPDGCVGDAASNLKLSRFG